MSGAAPITRAAELLSELWAPLVLNKHCPSLAQNMDWMPLHKEIYFITQRHFSTDIQNLVLISDPTPDNVEWLEFHSPKSSVPVATPSCQMVQSRAKVKVLGHCLHHHWMSVRESQVSCNLTNLSNDILLLETENFFLMNHDESLTSGSHIWKGKP